jgi:hypothetical protein
LRPYFLIKRGLGNNFQSSSEQNQEQFDSIEPTKKPLNIRLLLLLLQEESNQEAARFLFNLYNFLKI